MYSQFFCELWWYWVMFGVKVVIYFRVMIFNDYLIMVDL